MAISLPSTTTVDDNDDDDDGDAVDGVGAESSLRSSTTGDDCCGGGGGVGGCCWRWEGALRRSNSCSDISTKRPRLLPTFAPFPLTSAADPVAVLGMGAFLSLFLLSTADRRR